MGELLLFEEFARRQPRIQLFGEPATAGISSRVILRTSAYGQLVWNCLDQDCASCGASGRKRSRSSRSSRGNRSRPRRTRARKAVAVGMAVEKLLGDVVDSAVGETCRDEGVRNGPELFRRCPAADRVVDGPAGVLVHDEPPVGLDEVDSIRLLVHEQVRKTALAALRRLFGEFGLKQRAVRQGDGTERFQIDFHSTMTRCCLPGA